ncbi:MAG: DegT/DnrJ/EryC1/StrS family aminotransferase [Acidobacteria bacterium]|nr:DegT/DnrJ/EryC1/StrS family aminotransferase [Acidobacteriota bacterium]
MKIPLLDLKAQHDPIDAEIKAAVLQVIDQANYIMGPEVAQFEKAAGDYIGARHAIAVASGTDALLLSLRALGIGVGDEVITTPYSFFATAGAIANVGATPVFVDIEPDTYNINPKRIAARITPRTKAILPVHLFGQCADMDSILAVAGEHRLPVIEDAAQAFGAHHKGRKAGTLGSLGCFSFFPSKNLGGLGDGGMITTNDDALAERARMLRAHGGKEKYMHSIVGTNSRLDTLQAAVLLVKIKYIDGWHEGRRRNARYFDNAFAGIVDLKTPVVRPANYHIYNQYVVRSATRDLLVAHLKQCEIGYALYYPRPLHLQTCFSYLGYQPGDMPEAEAACRETVALPVYPELTDEQLQYIAFRLEQFFLSTSLKKSL